MVRVAEVAEKRQSVTVAHTTGKGKFSTVFRAAKTDGSGYVALKRIQIFNMMDEKSRFVMPLGVVVPCPALPCLTAVHTPPACHREKCLKEIHLVKSVSHRNIIAFYDAFIVNKELWLVFEYAEAGDLKRQLRKAR